MAPKPKKPKRTNKPSPLERMYEAFKIVNLDTDGLISREEFKKAMHAIGIDEHTADNLFNRFDPDGSGQLDQDEFFAYAAKGGGEVRSLIKKGHLEQVDEEADRVRDIFHLWDSDGNGFITKDELERVLVVLNPSFTKKEFTKMMKAADKNGDGEIDYQEFVDWLSESPTKK